MRQGKHFSKVEDDGTLTDVFVHLNPGPAHDLKASSLYWLFFLVSRPIDDLKRMSTFSFAGDLLTHET